MVELPKTEEGLGFNVMGGKEQNSPIYISRIIPGLVRRMIRIWMVMINDHDEYDHEDHECLDLTKSVSSTCLDLNMMQGRAAFTVFFSKMFLTFRKYEGEYIQG